MRLGLLCGCLALVLASSPVSAGVEIGIDLGRSKLYSPAYTAPNTVLTDDSGDDYSIAVGQPRADSVDTVGVDIRTPEIGRVGVADVGARLYASLGASSWRDLAILHVGPTIEWPTKIGRVTAGAYVTHGSLGLNVAELQAAHADDPGFEVGGTTIPPGTKISAYSTAAGYSVSLGAKLFSEALKVQLLHTWGARFSNYAYTAKGQELALPQLEPIDLSGSSLTVGTYFKF